MQQVSDFVQMTGPPEPHHILREKGLLHEWQPGGVGRGKRVLDAGWMQQMHT